LRATSCNDSGGSQPLLLFVPSGRLIGVGGDGPHPGLLFRFGPSVTSDAR
jgi:hypothetical protein